MTTRLHLVDLHGSVVDAARAAGWSDVFLHAWTDVSTIDAPAGSAFVSPANSLGFMDGGVDYVFSRLMFPGLERTVKDAIAEASLARSLDRPYLPIGKAIVVPTCRDGVRLVSAPTMWLPQDVRGTHNAYHAMYAALDAASSADPPITDLFFTGFCTGCGMMPPETAVRQMKEAHDDFRAGRPARWSEQEIVAEQPNYYMNSEFKPIRPEDVVTMK